MDLDGTLLGPGGSLFSAPGGGFALEGARALQACARAGVEVVIFTGRRQQGVVELARLIGQSSYIFELGCGLVLDGELEWLTDGCVPSMERGSIYEQIAASGAPGCCSRVPGTPRVPHAMVGGARGLPRLPWAWWTSMSPARCSQRRGWNGCGWWTTA